MYDLRDKKVFVAGSRGLVGGAIVRRLATENCEILTATRQEVDLRDQSAVANWMRNARPDVVFLAAAKVGGILANSTFPADFIYDNLMLQCNIINAAHECDVEKLIFLGSSCIYPKLADQPIVEEALLSGSLEPTNEWYAVAKIAGIKLCQAYRRQYNRDFISVMPTNLYGPGDNFDLNSSHVLPALIRKAHEAKVAGAQSMTIWGSGNPRREFLYSDDCADACVFLAKNYSDDLAINIGSGSDISILELTKIVCKTVGFSGEIICDLTKPDGTPRKLMSNSRLAGLGWSPSVQLETGIAMAYDWYTNNSSK